MSKINSFLQRKDIIFSPKRYLIDAMSAMAQGLFCTLLIGTILEKHLQENARATTETVKAVQDYNIMMGNLEDPSEEDEMEEE